MNRLTDEFLLMRLVAWRLLARGSPLMCSGKRHSETCTGTGTNRYSATQQGQLDVWLS